MGRMTTTQTETDLQVLRSDSFYRVGPQEFGMPGLIAVESVGPFVELMKLGPFITIHDSIIEAGKGIGHHPHRTNERLFYILSGEIRHDDSLNDIQAVMNAGDLARLTEGERGMLHQEWNGRDDIDAHAFILVYTPDVDPPIPTASFDALRADDRVHVTDAPGVESLHLIGGQSAYRANSSAITAFFDTTLQTDAAFQADVPAGEALIVYPLDGAVAVRVNGRDEVLRGSTALRAEGPDAMAVVWADGSGERSVQVQAVESAPARVLRIGFRRGDEDVVLHQPWRR
jgi:redox-sensitive bicupin YhaK (pirin superfamily)